MMDVFSFNGIASDSMGVLLAEEWVSVRAGIAFNEIEIEGRDGAILEPLNYQNVAKSLEATLMDKEREEDVIRWLKGKGIFELDGRYRKSAIFDPIEFKRHGPFKKNFYIPFIFEPFWYAKDEYARCDGSVVNLGNIEAVPLIKVTGEGIAVIRVADIRFTVSFDNTGEIEIDCLEKTEDKPKCINIGYEYPVLKPGRNEVVIESGNAEVFIKRKDRWLG